MANESARRLEWRISMPDGTSKDVDPESTSWGHRIWRGFQRLVMAFVCRVGGFFQKAWRIAVNDPKKPMHGVKVGLTLSLVSLFYYMRQLYDEVGGSAIWAVMTVVVAYEYTAGGTVYKSLNRTAATFLAGGLAVGVHWVARHSGPKLEPIILEGSVFTLGAIATFSRFIPSIKSRFDYGALIIVLTFSMVSVSSFREKNLFELACHRLATVAIGTAICVITSLVVRPVWAGSELHNLVKNNMEKLSDSLDGCVAEYFKDNLKNNDDPQVSNKMQGYKCALNSKSTEELMANFAKWEPAHGKFNFRHPWKEYLKVGASVRSCAYHIEALNSSISSDAKAPDFLNKHFSKFCVKVSVNSSRVLKELAVSIGTMKKSSKIDLMLEEMRNAVQELQDAPKSLSKQPIASNGPNSGDSVSVTGEGDVNPTIVTLVEIIPIVTITSLLIEIASRSENVAEAVNALADKAEFKVETNEEMKRCQAQEVSN